MTNKKLKKIYVCYGSDHDMSWVENAEYTRDLSCADAVVLTGGGDIHPSFYNGMAGVRHTWAPSERPGDRCLRENEVINEVIKLGIPLIGICRGFQWLCIKAGGFLVQDVSGHSHRSGVLADGELWYANSLHHQMVYPFDLPKDHVEIIGIINKPTSFRYVINGEGVNSIPAEVEIAYFPKIKGFGVQFHPEMMTSKYHSSDHEGKTLDYLNKLLYRTIWAQD